MASKQKLIVGLGNPGDKYAGTRHNAGFIWLNLLAEKYGASFKLISKFSAMVAVINIAETKVYLLKPITFMNNSGVSVVNVANYYNISVESILVVHDDLDLAVGKIKFKSGGGHGGHNGLRSIVNCLSSREFNRLRLGIGHPGVKADVSSYVLNNFSKVDIGLIDLSINQSIGAIDFIIDGCFDKAMNYIAME